MNKKKQTFEELTKEEKEQFIKECAEYDLENIDFKELYNIAYAKTIRDYEESESLLKEAYEFKKAMECEE